MVTQTRDKFYHKDFVTWQTCTINKHTAYLHSTHLSTFYPIGCGWFFPHRGMSCQFFEDLHGFPPQTILRRKILCRISETGTYIKLSASANIQPKWHSWFGRERWFRAVPSPVFSIWFFLTEGPHSIPYLRSSFVIVLQSWCLCLHQPTPSRLLNFSQHWSNSGFIHLFALFCEVQISLLNSLLLIFPSILNVFTFHTQPPSDYSLLRPR